MTADQDAARRPDLLGAAELLRVRLAAVALPLDVAGGAAARADLRAAVDQLDDHVLPRLRAGGAPLLVVVGGSTGAGKSTLVNGLLGERVTEPGVLRPTTRSPVLVHHPVDEGWFTTDRVLPGLARVSDAAGGDHGRALRLVATDALPAGLALLDAPDIDSVETANRELAAQLLAAADLWLFVTTAARYADAVPWQLLEAAAARHANVALVVDRVDAGAEAVVADLRRLLDAHGLGDAPLFAVPETPVTAGLLPETAVGEVAAWLTDLGADAGARAEVAATTLAGALDDLARRAGALAAAVEEQAAADERLRAAVRRHADDAVDQVVRATSDGTMLRGEVLARWQDLVGTGELLRAVEQRVSRLRDTLGRVVRGRPAPAPQAEQAIAHGLEAVVMDALDDAAERTDASWRADPAGVALADGTGGGRAASTSRAAVAEQVRRWQGDVLDLVREQGERKRGTARALSFGVNALGVALMVAVFASTGGLTGVEVGIAGGTAVLAQRLLEAVFGDDAVRRLTTTAHERLVARVRTLVEEDLGRYEGRLDALALEHAPQTAERLRSAADDVVAALAVAPDRVAPAPRSEATVRLRGADVWRRAHPGGRPGASGSMVPTAGEPGGATAGEAAGARPGFWRRLLGRRDGAGDAEGADRPGDRT